ncbi:hypothetical protein K493DRAFT_73776 [Basidiobolus meristosporus CBS 931.73]|uniref:Centromere protein X n=1 Tax=Basidiobolus meristosporus CBS 931.73 TaxID=1314790 RepID=A0A1Y1XT29_9FUNG|nr:hypothetical protein K493DRAFT_73776 [Basidiobolus meristosporus CBS 931.73]|eukprot:ORX88873.1 hypothetical protein K493DRAFT_73776 [Basidiobolus meristosporus CBS 931.73]
MEDPNTAEQPTFKPETIQSIFKTVWKESNTKIKSDAASLAADLLRLFTREAVHRSAGVSKTERADSEAVPRLEVEHLEKTAAQLLLDF